MRRASGFTLVELMVAASISMLLLAGAFEMHAAFNRHNIRQQEIADMQQSLRVAMQVIGRSLRDAGTGLGGGTAQLFNAGVAVPQPCPTPTGNIPVASPIDATHSCLWAVQYSNSNTYTNPKTAFDITAVGDGDTDADWLRVVSFDGGTAVRVDPATNPLATGVIGVSDTRFFTVGGFFLINNNYPAFLDANSLPTRGWRSSCIRQATAVNPAPNPASPTAIAGTVTFALNANNPAPGDACMTGVFPGPPLNTLAPWQGQAVYAFPVDRSVVFRVQPPAGPGVPPQLRAWYSAPGAPSFLPNVPVAQQPWQTLTENIEHMQIALVMSDGTVCGNVLNSVDSPALCNPQNIRAVRITLVARSSSPHGSVSGGVYSGWLSQGTGGQWEDFVQPAQQDGYLRRALTTEFQIRNVAWGSQ